MRLPRFFRRRYWDEERARELEAYVAQETDDNLARGMTPDAARAAARRRLGNPTRIREEIYDFNTVRWLETARFDLRDVLRQLRRRRHVALTTLLLLTLGIAASTAAFAVAYGTLLRPLPYPDADRLITVWQYTEGSLHQISAPDFRDLAAIPGFERAALFLSGRTTLTAGVEVDRVNTIDAEAPLLPLLGARALLGRVAGAADADQPVAAISRRLWQSVFHGDRGGVALAPAFTVKDVDVWRILGAKADLPDTRRVFTFEAVARLAPGARLDQAQAAADTIAANLARAYPDTNRGRGFRLVPLRQQVVGARATAIWIGLTGALLVLAIACVNALNLALGELPARRRRAGTGLHRERRGRVANPWRESRSARHAPCLHLRGRGQACARRA
ncbi:MAG: ABC transporter permease, partial [Acidobacteria bacterium]|nr:ABC transporter permease [Acidobacteriota bacterium]